jgi:hypothetical protein
MGRRGTTTLLAALPALVLTVAGLFHPHSLTTATADTWFRLHLVAMFVFPLVGIGLVVGLAGRRDPVAWLVRLAAFGYAVAYTALDVISGVTAGYVTSRLPDGTPRPEEVSLIFGIGTPVGELGSWALLVATSLLLLDGLRRLGPRAVALVVLPVGAWLVHVDHIFAPEGVVGMALIGVGTALVTWWSHDDTRLTGAERQPIRSDGRHSG